MDMDGIACNHKDHLAYKKLYKHLRHTARREKRNYMKDRCGAIAGRIGIDEGPKVVASRSRIGDIEVDFMLGSNHKFALLVMTDRTTLITMIEKLKSKKADEGYEKMNQRLTSFKRSWIKTITFDNGKEFAYHHKIAK
jgi:IS30 family transposase